MSESNPDRLPEHLLEVAERLREGRVSATPLELDELKLRAKAQAARGRSYGLRGAPLRSRVLTLALTALFVGGTTAGGIAASGGSGGSNAAVQQYKPGMGCGDKNHVHTGPPGNPDKNPATDCPKGSAQNP
jgi:phage tail tape-measure protein